MVEAVSAATPKQFSTVQYKTKEGETITATKKDGVVTLVGDKSGVRKMPIDDFKKELIANVPNLEKAPAKDSVEISKDAKAPVEVPDKEAKAQAKPETKAEVKEAKADNKEAKVADAKKAEELAKEEKEVKTDKAPSEEKAPAEEAKKPEIGKKLDVAA